MAISEPLLNWLDAIVATIPTPVRIAEYGDQGCQHGQAGNYYRAKGCQHLSFDISGRCAVPLDLGQPIPEEYVGKFDVVTNFGTIEHINGQYHAWRNMHLLCVPGGVIAHALPLPETWPEHGRYYYDERFITKLAFGCGYEIMDVFRHVFYPDDPSTELLCVSMRRRACDFLSPDEFAMLPILDTGDMRNTGDYMTPATKTWRDIQGWFDFEDLYAGVTDEAVDGARFVEIGVWLGTSAAFMGERIKQSRKKIEFFAVDTFKGTAGNDPIGQRVYPPLLAAYGGDLYPAFLRNMLACGLADIVKPIPTLSIQAAEKFADESLDFLFIDGSHDYENVCADLQAWLPKVKPGGIVAGHDTDFAGVLDAVRSVFRDNFKMVGQRSWLTRKPKPKPLLGTSVRRPKVYALTCRQLPWREKALRSQLASSAIEAEVFYGVHGPTLGLTPIHPGFDTSEVMGTGYVGLFLSNLCLWHLVLGRADEEVLVLEDDAVPCDRFWEEFDRSRAVLPDDWQMVYVGSCCCEAKPTEVINDRVSIVKWPLCTHAMLYRRSALPEIIRRMSVCSSHIDIQLERLVAPYLRTYVFRPELIRQRYAAGDISTMGGSRWHDIPGWFDFESLYENEIRRVHEGTFVEVGTYLGRSAAYLAERIKVLYKPIRFFAVDTFDGGLGPDRGNYSAPTTAGGGSFFEQWTRNMAAAGVADFCEPVVGASVNVAATFPDRSCDFVFIDGDHATESVVADIRAWAPKVKMGGTLAGHDIDQGTILQAVTDCLLPFRVEGRCWVCRDWRGK